MGRTAPRLKSADENGGEDRKKRRRTRAPRRDEVLRDDRSPRLSAKTTSGVALPNEDLVEKDEDKRDERHEHGMEVSGALRHHVRGEAKEQIRRKRRPASTGPSDGRSSSRRCSSAKKEKEIRKLTPATGPQTGGNWARDQGQKRDRDVGGIVGAKGNVDPMAEEGITPCVRANGVHARYHASNFGSWLAEGPRRPARPCVPVGQHGQSRISSHDDAAAIHRLV